MARKKKNVAELEIDVKTNVAKLSKDVQAMTREMEKMGRQMNSMNKMFKAAFSFDVIKSALPYIKQFGNALNTLAARGEVAGSIAAGFEKLGGTTAMIEDARKKTIGLVDSFELMKLANQGLVKQIPTFRENFGDIADLGARLANTLGMEVKPAIEKVTMALTGASIEQLASIGIHIDQNRVYDEFAAKTGKVASQLTETERIYARQVEAIRMIKQNLQDIAPVQESVANSETRMKNALSDGLNVMGMAVNGNKEFQASYDDLTKAIQAVDWERLGTSLGQIGGAIVDSLTVALPIIESFFNYIAERLNLLDRWIMYWKAEGVVGSLGKARESLEREREQADNPLLQAGKQTADISKRLGLAKTKEDVQALIPEIKKLADLFVSGEFTKENAKGLFARLAEVIYYAEDLEAKLPTATEAGQRHAKEFSKNFGTVVDAANKAKTALDSYNNEIARMRVESAIENFRRTGRFGQGESLESIKQQLINFAKEDFKKQWETAIASGAISIEEVEARAEEFAKTAGDSLQDEITRGGAQAFDVLSVGLQRIAGEFSSELAQTIGAVTGLMTDEMKSGISEAFGLGTGTEGTKQLEAWLQAGTTVIGAIGGSKRESKRTKSEKGTGEATGAVAGAVVGGVIGSVVPVIGTAIGAAIGAVIGKFLGGIVGSQFKWGAQHPETKSRHQVMNWFEDQMAKRDAFLFQTLSGQMSMGSGRGFNFFEGGSNRFNQATLTPNVLTGDWAENFQQYGNEAVTVFTALGNAISEVLGVTEDVGEQIGYLLAENMAGNIDNARYLVAQLGLDFEELSNALFEMAKKGSITWLDWASQTQGLEQAFEIGRVGYADMIGAVDAFIASGGRGVGAIKAVRDLAQEAIESGAQTLEQLKARLIEGGMTEQQATDFVAAVRAQGVQSISEILNLSEQQTGHIIAQVNAANQSIAEEWKKIGDELERVNVNLDRLPSSKDIKINFSATYDPNMRRVMDSDVLSQGDFSVGAVDSPDYNRGMVSSSGTSVAKANAETKAFRAATVNLTIDASNAETGVEQKIEQIILSYSDLISQQAAEIVMNNLERT